MKYRKLGFVFIFVREVYSGNESSNVSYDEIFPSGTCPHVDLISVTQMRMLRS